MSNEFPFSVAIQSISQHGPILCLVIYTMENLEVFSFFRSQNINLNRHTFFHHVNFFLFFLPRFLSYFFLSLIYSFPTVIWLALCISLLKMISYFPKTQCLQRILPKLFIALNPSSYPLTCIEPQPIVIPSQKLSSFH